MFIERRPSPPLRPFVDRLWYFETDLEPGHERVLPSGAMQLLVNLEADEMRWYSGPRFDTVNRLGGSMLVGPFETPVVIDTMEQRQAIGVAFTPMGTSAFLRCPAHAVRGLHVPLDLLWGIDGRVLRECLLEAESPHAMLARLDAWLLARGAGRLAIDSAITFAVTALDRGARVGPLVERLGLSPKRFIERFEAQVGLTPKRFARIRRFQRVLTLIGGTSDWTERALQSGYFDQSHMIRDFQELAGTSPSHYKPRSAIELNHVPVNG